MKMRPLDERERKILRMRYGTYVSAFSNERFTQATLQQIAKHFNISRQRVSQIINDAKAKVLLTL